MVRYLKELDVTLFAAVGTLGKRWSPTEWMIDKLEIKGMYSELSWGYASFCIKN